MSGGALVLDHVILSVGGRPLFEPVSVSVAPGEIVTLMGPSGSGKSSLLNYVCGTLNGNFRATGAIRLDGHDITGLPPERRRVGILFQDDLLFPHLSVGENLAFAIPPEVKPRRDRWQRVEAALQEVGLQGFAGRDPSTLSGGQRARVALLRTLLANPRALLLDEPFSKLDGPLRARFRRQVFDHARARHLPTLLVTHDPGDADATDGRALNLAIRTDAAEDTGPNGS